jgi:hypothetical protein
MFRLELILGGMLYMLTEIDFFGDCFRSWEGTCVIVYDFYLV